MIADSRYNNHYVMLNTPILNKKLATTPIHILHPNGTRMSSTHTCELPLVALSPIAHKSHVIPSLTSGALFYLGQLCNDGYYVFLDKIKLHIYKDDNIILTGDRDFTTGMWIDNIPHSSVPSLFHPSPLFTTSPPNIESDIHYIPFQVELYDPHHCNSVYE